MIPKPLVWGIVIVLTLLEALNVCAAIWVKGYQSDALVHFSFTSVVGFMLGMKEGNHVIARALSALRGQPAPPPGTPPSPSGTPGSTEPPP
jgi:hypothetical protein